MTEFEIEMRGKLIAQSYLIELALGSILAANPQRVQLLEKLRFDVLTQLRSDYSSIGPGVPSPDAAMAVIASATDALTDHIDRMIGQFSNPKPPIHHA